jgi:hypothetical protein
MVQPLSSPAAFALPKNVLPKKCEQNRASGNIHCAGDPEHAIPLSCGAFKGRGRNQRGRAKMVFVIHTATAISA